MAGSLLIWRLARTVDWSLELVTGPAGDATAASGGAVRAYEAQPDQRRLSLTSLVELLASEVLRGWAAYAPATAVCLTRDHAAVTAAAAEIERALPGSADLPSPAELTRTGWAGLAGDEAAIRERRAGSISPDRLRTNVLADVGARVRRRSGPVTSITTRAGGPVQCQIRGRLHQYDLVVLAAGAWTGQLLRRAGHPADTYRVKSIQYSVHATGAWLPPQFVDEITGVFGLPQPGAEILIGAPSEEWGVNPDHPPVTPRLHDLAADRARARFPDLSLGPVVRRVASADCYSDPPFLSLQRVRDQLFTFSGGAGGSAKTALAASTLAADHLVTARMSTERG